jgi:hypothetical protein
LFTDKLVKFHIRGLIVNNLIEKRTNCSLSNQELVEEGTSDLLNKQLVEKIPISPISMQIHDVLVNLKL